MSGANEFLPLECPVRDTRAGQSSLKRNYTKFTRFHIFQARDLSDSLK